MSGNREAGPGERRGGREKGSRNKARVEREMEIARAVAALNRPLGKEVIAPANYPR
jgi:hypothetical protein